MLSFLKARKCAEETDQTADNFDEMTDAIEPAPLLPEELMCVDSVPMNVYACMHNWSQEY